MKYLSLLAFFIFFTTSLDAAYARTIRVSSFVDEQSAREGAAELRKFVQRDYRLSELQREFNFQVTFDRSGRYYLTVITPVTRRDAVQEILDIVRTRHPEAYPKKISLESPRRTYREEAPRINREDLTHKVDTILTAQKIQKPKEEEIDVENIELKSVHIDDIVEDEIIENPKPFANNKIVLRKATHEDVTQENHEEGFILFGINIGEMLDSISFDKLNIFSEDTEGENVQNFIDSKLDKLNNYIVEIGVVFAFLMFLIFIKLYLVYQGRKEDKISMQDIYDS